jgi:ubiquinone/menaquinone biosynthesis C-methylase UbiE
MTAVIPIGIIHRLVPQQICDQIRIMSEADIMETYVHGYSEMEAGRLIDQADTLAELLHSTIRFPEGSRVLEAGCGIGAQTIHLARNSPRAQFTSIDLSPESLERARQKLAYEQLSNVLFEVADVYQIPYAPGTFDHIFVCFLLEHLSDPLQALSGLRQTLRDGGSISAIEGDHGSYYCHPKSPAADRAVQCLIDLQARRQGDSLIGRQLYPLLAGAGFREVRVTPRIVYVDSSRPDLVEGFTRKTFIAMVEGVKDEAISLGLISEEAWDQGIADLYRTTREDGTFCYTFFQATALK